MSEDTEQMDSQPPSTVPLKWFHEPDSDDTGFVSEAFFSQNRDELLDSLYEEVEPKLDHRRFSNGIQQIGTVTVTHCGELIDYSIQARYVKPSLFKL